MPCRLHSSPSRARTLRAEPAEVLVRDGAWHRVHRALAEGLAHASAHGLAVGNAALAPALGGLALVAPTRGAGRRVQRPPLPLAAASREEASREERQTRAPTHPHARMTTRRQKLDTAQHAAGDTSMAHNQSWNRRAVLVPNSLI